MSGFNAGSHFDSGRLAKCEKCERLGEGPWPAGWLLCADGILCPGCAFPDPVLAERLDTMDAPPKSGATAEVSP